MRACRKTRRTAPARASRASRPSAHAARTGLVGRSRRRWPRGKTGASAGQLRRADRREAIAQSREHDPARRQAADAAAMAARTAEAMARYRLWRRCGPTRERVGVEGSQARIDTRNRRRRQRCRRNGRCKRRSEVTKTSTCERLQEAVAIWRHDSAAARDAPPSLVEARRRQSSPAAFWRLRSDQRPARAAEHARSVAIMLKLDTVASQHAWLKLPKASGVSPDRRSAHS